MIAQTIRRTTIAVAVTLLPGCSLIYDAGAFDVPDGAPDALIADAAPPPDVDPSMLTLSSVTPEALLEGQGSAGTGRAIPILLTGQMIAPDAVISLEVVTESTDAGVGLDAGELDAGSSDGGVPVLPSVGDTVVSSDGTMAATTMVVPVMEQLGDGDLLEMRIVLTQGDFSESLPFVIQGLDELTVSASSLDTDAPRPARFSRITVDQDVHLFGSKPARLHATAEIIVSAVLDADGRGGGAPGAGGCGGGSVGAGGCGMGGGGAGASGILQNGPGGGGGGFGGVGTMGSGGTAQATAGAAGMQTGNDTLVPIDTASGQPGNRGNGGGSGGTGLLGGAGGIGGGGGGVIELRSGGTLIISGTGAIRANGGPGTNGSGGGGGGGGGSGGAILLHAANGITNELGTAVVRAEGGPGGNLGGAGGIGRIRIDSPSLPFPLVVAPTAIRGPVWLADMPTIVRSPTIEASLAGEPGRDYSIWIGEDEQDSANIGVSGTRTVPLTLPAGRSLICAYVGENQITPIEASMCRAVIYLP